MMNIKELNEAIEKWENEEEDEGRDFLSWIRDEVDFDLAEGLSVKFISGERHNSNYTIIFSVGEQLYSAQGSYDSWNGVDMSYADIIEVKKVRKTVTVYEPV